MATTKLGLILPAAGPAPVGLINRADLANNFQKIDDFFGIVICTSGTRPSSPYAAQLIYETDTRMMLVRNAANSAWVMTDRVPSVAATGDIAVPYTGQLIWVTAVNLLYRYTGSSWTPVTMFAQSANNTVTTQEQTASTSFVDLTTPGPAVTIVSVGTQALVTIRAKIFAASGTVTGTMGFVVSGATTRAAADADSVTVQCTNVGDGFYVTGQQLITIVPGSNTYTAKFHASLGTAVFAQRRMYVFAP